MERECLGIQKHFKAQSWPHYRYITDGKASRELFLLGKQRFISKRFISNQKISIS